MKNSGVGPPGTTKNGRSPKQKPQGRVHGDEPRALSGAVKE